MFDLRKLFTVPGFPRRGLSRFFGYLARRTLPRRLRSWMWPFMARRFGIDFAEVPGKWEDYACFLDVFTRPLPPDSRPIPLGPTWLSPADGRIVADCSVTPEGSWLIKGTPYSTQELLPGLSARQLTGYRTIQIYLSPKDYHRFHVPCDLEILEAVSSEGGLQPVDPDLVRRSMRILVRNRRVLLHCQAKDGSRLSLLFVGALNVGQIRFTFDGSLGTEPFVSGHRHYQPPIHLSVGDELGRFELGSTVLVFTPPDRRPLMTVGNSCRALEPLWTGGREMEK